MRPRSRRNHPSDREGDEVRSKAATRLLLALAVIAAFVAAAGAFTGVYSVIKLSVTQQNARENSIHGCQRLNLVRELQAGQINTQIVQTRKSLKKSLGPALEPFRKQIKEGLEQQEHQLVQLQISARPAQPGQPYRVDCNAVYEQ